MQRPKRDEVLLFVALEQEGFSYREIGKKMERDRETVARHIKGYTEQGEQWFTHKANQRT